MTDKQVQEKYLAENQKAFVKATLNKIGNECDCFFTYDKTDPYTVEQMKQKLWRIITEAQTALQGFDNPPKVFIYSNHKCTFQYCPNPELCMPDGCISQHKTPPTNPQ